MFASFRGSPPRTKIPGAAAQATPPRGLCAKFERSLLLAGDNLHPAHIGLQHVRHGDRAVFLLVGFHDRDQRAADRGAGAVQGVHETRLAVGTALTRVHSPRLEIAAQRAARDFAIGAALALT